MIRLILPPLCVARKMTVDSENIDNATKISQTNKERERTFIFLSTASVICSGTFTGHKSWGRIVISVKHVKVAPALAAPSLLPRAQGCSCQAAPGVAPAAFQHLHLRCLTLQPQQALQSQFFSFTPSLTEEIRLLLFMARGQKMRVHQSRTKSVLASDPFSASFQVKNQAFPAWLWNGF